MFMDYFLDKRRTTSPTPDNWNLRIDFIRTPFTYYFLIPLDVYEKTRLEILSHLFKLNIEDFCILSDQDIATFNFLDL